ncbi:MAG: hypothetical protein WC657_02365 [Candidatus Paceibacterota bacterium]|jgi:hypothetical protein
MMGLDFQRTLSWHMTDMLKKTTGVHSPLLAPAIPLTDPDRETAFLRPGAVSITFG